MPGQDHATGELMRDLTTTTLADAIADGLSDTACGGHVRNGCAVHVCPSCQARRPAFALVDCRALAVIDHDFICDGCWSAIERNSDQWAEVTGA